jgi:hypothetical protein
MVVRGASPSITRLNGTDDRSIKHRHSANGLRIQGATSDSCGDILSEIQDGRLRVVMYAM